MKYYKRAFAESLNERGNSVSERQIEVYDDGSCSKYDHINIKDELEGLSDQPLDLDEFSEFLISKEEFEIELDKFK